MNRKKAKSLSTIEILQALGNPVRKAIVTSLASGTALKFSGLMQASGLNPKFDTGHFGYHLLELMKRGIVVKKNDIYQLSNFGLKLPRILDAVQRESSSLSETQNGGGGVGMNEKDEFWEKYFLGSMMAGWSRAEGTVEGICRVFAENGITEGKVLDLCCGTGRLSIWLAKKEFRVIGLDSSPLYLEEATRRASEYDVESKVKFLLGDMRKVDQLVGSESPFDCVISFWGSNAIGYWGEKTDEMILTKAREMTKKGGILVIGERDHLAQLMLAFDKRRIYEYENAITISEANMDYISNMFKATFNYYTKEGEVLKYFDSYDFQVRVYSVCELSSLLERAGWKVTKAYESIETLQPFTHRTIFKGNKSMNIVAKAV